MRPDCPPRCRDFPWCPSFYCPWGGDWPKRFAGGPGCFGAGGAFAHPGEVVGFGAVGGDAGEELLKHVPLHGMAEPPAGVLRLSDAAGEEVRQRGETLPIHFRPVGRFHTHFFHRLPPVYMTLICVRGES